MKPLHLPVWIALAWLLLVTDPARSAALVDPATITPASSSITVDGRLDEAAWRDAVRFDLPWEWSPGNNLPAIVETHCWVTFDEDQLYVAFHAFDPEPAKIRAHLADRDTPFLEDTVGFFLDTFNDERRGYQFRINPLGVQMDAVNSDVGGGEDWSWDIIWDSAGRIVDDGYVVEVAIPFTQLRFPSQSGPQTWGFLALRDYPRSVRHRFRSVQRQEERNCLICQFQKADGVVPRGSSRNLELYPTVTGTRTDRRETLPDGPLMNGDEEVEAGLTARWSPRPSLTASATINPDFSQVEADSAQLEVNERFALFFDERRPFFLEGADFFSTPINAVFTRTIADPAAGLKLTGKEGPNAYGVFVAEDRINNLLLPANQGSSTTSLDQDVLSGVVRYRRDLGASSTLGVLYAGRNADDYSNQVFGIDGRIQLSPSDTLRFQALGSETEYPDGIVDDFGQPNDELDDQAFFVQYLHADRDWNWNLGYSDYGADFRADSGFVPRVDQRRAQGGIQRSFFGDPDAWYRRLGVFLGADSSRDQSGEIEEWGVDLALTYEGPWQTRVQLVLAPNEEYFQGVDYDNFRQRLNIRARPTGSLGFGFVTTIGETIDFRTAQQADLLEVTSDVDFNLGRGFKGRVGYSRRRLEADGEQLVDADILQARLVYHFSLRSFVRAIVQYRELDQSDADTSPSEALFNQILFSYKLNPQTVVLAGYSDNARGNTDFDLSRTNRTFFLKFGYAVLF